MNDSHETEIKQKHALSGWPMVLFWLIMFIFAGHASTHMVGAGDTWVAMACGRHFINHGVDTVEPFSANSHRPGPTQEEIDSWPGFARTIAKHFDIETIRYWHPTGWVNQNWLTHVIFYWLVNTFNKDFSTATFEHGEFNILVYWKFAIYIITVITVFYTARLIRVNPALAATFAAFAMFVARSFLDIRPQGFTNMLVAVFLFLLVLTTYRHYLYIWLVVPLVVFWCNVHGGYIYVFIMLVPFIGWHLVMIIGNALLKKHHIQPKGRLIAIGPKGVTHAIAAFVVAFIATIVFNPFHLTNLTHTYEVSFSAHAEMWRTVNEWHPAFEWSNPVGTGIPFLIMFIMALLILPVWLIIIPTGPRITAVRSKHQRVRTKPPSVDEYEWPRIDVALIFIAALTVYMAYRSRRFIPIAAIAACPLTAMMLDQIVRMISAVANFKKAKGLVVSPMPRQMQVFACTAAIAAVLVFGTWWGLKYKRIYLDPWGDDSRLASVFMRMTASHAKPFYAMNFIRDNKISGKMFNYWTEGGFIAWGQDPDPNTGKTPLQLFMDGRAQAAYNTDAYNRWQAIMMGGPESYKVRRLAGRKPTAKEFEKIGEWISEELRKNNVWVTLMPAAQFSSDFVMGLEHNPDWRIVFMNNGQKLFVDVKTEQGEKLYKGLFDGTTVNSDDFSRLLTLSHNLLRIGDRRILEGAFAAAAQAFQLDPSRMPIAEIFLAGNLGMQQEADRFCESFVQDFINKKNEYEKRNGYARRLRAAVITSERLTKSYADKAGKADDPESEGRKRFYASRMNEFVRELMPVSAGQRW
ncbi:MAG: hypothetical protein ABIG61_16985 [Planctomycetota bacterium]